MINSVLLHYYRLEETYHMYRAMLRRKYYMIEFKVIYDTKSDQIK